MLCYDMTKDEIKQKISSGVEGTLWRPIDFNTSKAEDHLNTLVEEDFLCKCVEDLYYYPKQTKFGRIENPPDREVFKKLGVKYFLVGHVGQNSLGFSTQVPFRYSYIAEREVKGLNYIVNYEDEDFEKYRNLSQLEVYLVWIINHSNEVFWEDFAISKQSKVWKWINGEEINHRTDEPYEVNWEKMKPLITEEGMRWLTLDNWSIWYCNQEGKCVEVERHLTRKEADKKYKEYLRKDNYQYDPNYWMAETKDDKETTDKN